MLFPTLWISAWTVLASLTSCSLAIFSTDLAVSTVASISNPTEPVYCKASGMAFCTLRPSTQRHHPNHQDPLPLCVVSNPCLPVPSSTLILTQLPTWSSSRTLHFFNISPSFPLIRVFHIVRSPFSCTRDHILDDAIIDEAILHLQCALS